MGGEKEYRKRNALRARDDYFDEWGAKKRRSQSNEPKEQVYRATQGDYATRVGAKPFKSLRRRQLKTNFCLLDKSSFFFIFMVLFRANIGKIKEN